jgi:hypothetical protein
MPLQGQVVQAPAGVLGFDTDTSLNAVQAKQKYNQGYRFCVRYVPHTRGVDSNFDDITSAEAQAIIDAGLGLMIVQHPPSRGWAPNGQLGRDFGSYAAAHAGEAEIPAGVTIFADLEGVDPAAPAQDVIDFCNAWFDQLRAVGYVPGLYIGSDPGLSADQLYWDLRVQHYWRGGSSVSSGVPADIPQRGYQLVQRISDPGGPAEFDSDVTNTDHFGLSVTWVCNPAAAAVA